MIYQRGNPKDYDYLANVTGDPEWKYEHLLQFFKKSEDYHGNYPGNGNTLWKALKIEKLMRNDYIMNEIEL